MRQEKLRQPKLLKVRWYRGFMCHNFKAGIDRLFLDLCSGTRCGLLGLPTCGRSRDNELIAVIDVGREGAFGPESAPRTRLVSRQQHDQEDGA